MVVGEDYIADRKQNIIHHWKEFHLGERVKIRRLAQLKLSITSNRIEENMKKNDIKKIRYSGWSYDSNNL